VSQTPADGTLLCMQVLAGMPMLTFTEIGKLRVEALSFFLLVFFICAAAVMWIWNSLRRDFVKLPRLSYPKAVGVVTLWGLAFGLVLTMISGARELLTPGAWEKDGVTYRLTAAQKKEDLVSLDLRRNARLQDLKTALWNYARSHDGALPSSDSDPAVPQTTWQTADSSRARFGYIPGRKVGVGSDIVAYEPTSVFASPRAVFSDGGIRSSSHHEIDAALKAASASAQAKP
jgi:hypothetical protein